jgi:hypothetical protein
MNQPTSQQPTPDSGRFAEPTLAVPSRSPIDLLDACGDGYTATDLARALAANARATASTQAA